MIEAASAQLHHQQHIEREVFSKTTLGFWVYIMTDCVLFATLFAVYAVLHNNTYGGPSAKELFSLPFVLTETLILLTSSFTCGLMMLAGQSKRKKDLFIWLLVIFILGCAFLILEVQEFRHLVAEGNSWQRSAFLSSYFTLVGTHGVHITIGLLWICVLLKQMMSRGLSGNIMRRLACFSMYWHFLDVVWIFIFTIVYLMGAI